MKRKGFLASVLALGVTAAGLSGLPTAAVADPECRYMIINPPAMQDDTVEIISNVTDDFRIFGHDQPGWSVVAVRPADGVDYDLVVDACPGKYNLGLSNLSGNAVDFVAIDGNRDWKWQIEPNTEATLYAFRNLYGPNPGTFHAIYATSGGSLAGHTSEELYVGSEPALIRDVELEPGETATIKLQVHEGDADLALVSSNTSQQFSWARSRIQAAATSAQPGLTEEVITISVSTTDPDRTFGIVVINNSRGGGHYTLVRE